MAQFPGIYRSPYGDSIAALMARQGEIAARGAEQKGALWSQAINQLGQIGAGAVQAHQEQKAQKQRQSMFNEALASWDPANPGTFYRAAAVAYGPEMALSALKALTALEASKQKSEPDPKLFAPKVEFIGKMWKADPGYVKENWPGFAQALGGEAKALYGLNLTPEWDDAYAGVLDSLAPKEKAEGGYTLGPREIRFDASGKKIAEGAPAAEAHEMPQSVEQQLAAAALAGDQAKVDTLLGVKRSVAAATRAGGNGRDVLGEVPDEWRAVIDRSISNLPSTRYGQKAKALARIASTGDLDELRGAVMQAAVEGEPVDRGNQIVGRQATMASLADARLILEDLQKKGIPTGWLSGNMENLARRLGKTTNPEYVALGNRLMGTLINYRRAATGVQFGDKEAAQYEQMFPNYRQELPVNLALIRGLEREMRTYDRVYWEGKLGKKGARLIGAVTDDDAPKSSGAQVGERRKFGAKIGQWNGKEWVRVQ